MRIRLRPDSLGELNVKVATSGNQVKLQIQASDERSRKILEDSVNHLKESLSAQNLSLAKLEVSVASANAGAQADNQPKQEQGSQSQAGGYQDLLNSRQQQSSSSQGNGGGRNNAYDSMVDLDPIVSIRRGAAAAAGNSQLSEGAARGRVGGGRLDVRA